MMETFLLNYLFVSLEKNISVDVGEKSASVTAGSEFELRALIL